MAMPVSILKCIGGSSSRLKSHKDAISYILDPNKTTKTLTKQQYLSETDLTNSWSIMFTPKQKKFISSWEANSTERSPRLFHHGIIAPQCTTESQHLTEDTLLDIASELMKIYKDYPMITSVHTDKPHRIHLHYLIHPINIHTKRAFQSSKAHLWELKCKLNEYFKTMGIAPIPHKGSTTNKHSKVYFSKTEDTTDAEDNRIQDIYEPLNAREYYSPSIYTYPNVIYPLERPIDIIEKDYIQPTSLAPVTKLPTKNSLVSFNARDQSDTFSLPVITHVRNGITSIKRRPIIYTKKEF